MRICMNSFFFVFRHDKIKKDSMSVEAIIDLLHQLIIAQPAIKHYTCCMSYRDTNAV